MRLSTSWAQTSAIIPGSPPCRVCPRNSPAALLQPAVQGARAFPDAGAWFARDGAAHLDVLLDLSLLPSRSWITELGFEQVIGWSWPKNELVDAAFLAAADLVRGGARMLSYMPAAAALPPRTRKAWLCRVEQLLPWVCSEMSADGERPAVAKLSMRHLRLDTNATDDREAHSLQSNWKASPGANDRGTEASPPGSLLQPMTFLLPGPGKRRRTIVGSVS